MKEIFQVENPLEGQTAKKFVWDGAGGLVITRKREQAMVLQCGDKTITLQIIKIMGNQVRIRVLADLDVKVHRCFLSEKVND